MRYYVLVQKIFEQGTEVPYPLLTTCEIEISILISLGLHLVVLDEENEQTDMQHF